MKAKAEIFRTPDAYLSSFLTLYLKQQPDIEKSTDGKILFSFPESVTLYRGLTAYNAGEVVNSILFAETIKRLKGMMISKKYGNQRDSRG